MSETLKEPLKVKTVLASEYVIVKDGKEAIEIKYSNTKTAPIYSTTDLNEWFIMNVQNPIDTDMEEFQETESGWSLKSILNLVVNIYKFNPMRGSSYIDLPPFIKNKVCINVENKDDECFKWAILSARHPSKKMPIDWCLMCHIKTNSTLRESIFQLISEKLESLKNKMTFL